MSKAIVRSGMDAFVRSAYPNANYAAATRLWVKSSEARSFVFFKSPVPQNSAMTVSSAVLRFRNAVALTGSVTMTVQRVASSVKWRRLTWGNQPGVTGGTATQTITSPTTSTWWEIDVTAQVQAIANGAANYGWRITTDSTTLARLYSLNAAQFKPTLVVEWTDKPDTPVVTYPLNGKRIDTAKPKVRMTYSDPGGDDALDAVQVQIDAAGNFVSGIDFDSGWVTATEPELDLAATAYAGLADAATTTLRCRVRDEAGGISEWSDPVTFTRDDKGTLTLTSPAASPNNFVDEFTPPIAWTFTGEAQKAYRITIARASHPHTWVYDSGRVTSAATEHTVPFRWHGRRVLRDDLNYIVTLRVWDTKDRCGIASVSASRTFAVQYDATLAPITSFVATQPGLAPWVQLDWNRATMPDQWVIVRDGEVIEKYDIAGDLLVSGTSYRFTDYTARPMVAHTYKIRAVDIVTSVRKMAATSPTATITPIAENFHLTNDDGSLNVFVLSPDPEGMAYGEDSAVLVPLGAVAPTRITSGMRGLEGSVSGIIVSSSEATWDDYKQDLLAIKAAPSTTYRLAFGDENIPVVLGNVSVSPSSFMTQSNPALKVSFDFWQNGDLPFDAEL
jgi:hypothetical protein